MLKLWARLSYAGVKEEMGFETKRRIILLNRIALALFLTVFKLRTVVIALGYQDFSAKAIMPYFAMLLILSIPYFNNLGYYRINAFIFSSITPLCFLFFSALSQTTNAVININHYYVPRIFILVTIVLPLILIDHRDKVYQYTAILINILCIVFFDLVVNIVGVPFDINTVSFENIDSISRVMILPAILMVLAFLFLTNLNRKYEAQIIQKNDELKQVNEELLQQKDIISAKHNELEQVNEEITCQRDLIEEKSKLLEKANLKIETFNRKLTDSISYARDIQHAVLGKELLPDAFFSESFIFFKPQTDVSGDFYYYKEVKINNKSCLLIAAVDCTGHGVPGGFLSMLGITLLNEILLNKTIKNAADILNQLREKVKTALNQTGKLIEQKDGMDMALCIYCPEQNELEYAGARMPLCIINSLGEMEIIKADRQPIGVFLKEKAFTNHHLKLDKGDMVYAFSDGLPDQFGGSEGKKLKFNGLQSFLLDIYTKPCPDQKLQIETFFNNWVQKDGLNKFEQIDDIVLIGMRV